MLTYNDYAKTQECIETIREVLDDDLFYEFLILDNNSQASTRDYIRSLSGKNKIKTVLSDTKLGIPAGRNRLFHLAKGEIIASLDSDVKLIDVDYFYKAVRVLTHVPDVALCGMPAYYTHFINQELVLNSCQKEGYADCVSGCCQIFYRYLLNHIRLDERFSPFWCEDTDFCFQIKKINKQVYYLPGEYGLYHDYRSKTDRKSDKDKEIKERYLVEKWNGKVTFCRSNGSDPRAKPMVLPGLWILRSDITGVPSYRDVRDVESLFGDRWYPQYHVLTKENIDTYLPDLPRSEAGNPIYIQLLLLFKYGGICIGDRYIHRDNLFNCLFHKMADHDLDLILFKYRNEVQNDVIVARKRSTLLHKSLVCRKISGFADLGTVFGKKCCVVDHFIGDAGSFDPAGTKLLRLKGNEHPAELIRLKISAGHKSSGRMVLFDMPAHTMNPCVMGYHDEYCLIARHESKLTDALNSRTKNVLYFLDRAFNIRRQIDLTLVLDRNKFIQRNRVNLSDHDFIVEDIRFITNTGFQDHKIPVVGNAMVDYENDYVTRISLLELDVKEHTLTFIKFLHIDTGGKIEKNWNIFYENRHCYIIYKIDPLEIYRCEMDFGDIQLHHRQDVKITERHVKPNYKIRHDLIHLSSMVDFDKRYYLILFRFYTYDPHYDGQMKRIYSHFGVLMNKQSYRLDYIIDKDIMSRFSYNIIINNSAIRIGDEVFFFCGFNDTQCGYIKYSIDALRNQRTRV